MANIVHIVESTATGTLSVLAQIANQQSLAGHQVALVYSARKETPSNLASLFDDNIRLHRFNMTGLRGFTQLVGLRVELLALKPDIVICHSSTAGFLGRIAGLGIRAKFFYIPHCLATMRQDISSLKRLLFTLGEWFAAVKNADYIAVSKSERIEIQKRIPFRTCHLLENAVDIDFWRGDVAWCKRKDSVITVGQIRQQKGPQEFADIAVKLRERGVDLNFVWIGDGNDEKMKAELRRAGVEITGWRTAGEVRKYLRESKFYLSTSRWEGLPVSPLEAMAAGCVAVLSNCPGNSDIVVNNSTGFLFDSTASGAGTLELLSQNRDLAGEIAASGNTACEQHYSTKCYHAKLSAILFPVSSTG